MKLCIPVLENHGLESNLSPHFGKAPAHLVVDSETRQILSALERSERAEGECAPITEMAKRGVEAVVCGGLGQGAFARLQAQGIQVFRTEHKTVANLLADLSRQALAPMDPAGLCAGHHHHEHGHTHDHQH